MLAAAAAQIALLSSSPDAKADPPPLTRTTFGSVGLIDMPSARMAPDGTLSASASYFQDTQRYSLGFEVLPWLEVAFRYAGLQHFNVDYPVYYDRSFALKAKLWDETALRPAVAVGLNDLVGTGVYGGEYIVASKQFGSIDASIGLGFGRLGTANTIRNPLGALSRSFYDRSSYYGEGGNFNINQYFHGPTSGIFGGASWRTPLDGLTMLAEFSSDAYTLETTRGNFQPKNQFNIGVAYEPFEGVNTGLYWMYGKVVGVNLSFQFDPAKPGPSQKVGTPPASTPYVRTDEEQRLALSEITNHRAPAKRPSSVALAENLWQRANVVDTELRGQKLLVFVNDATTPAQCSDIGASTAAALPDVTEIVVVNKTRNTRVQCGQPIAASRAIATPAVWNTQDAAAAQRTVMTIDASGPRRGSADAALASIRKDARDQRIVIAAADINGATASIYYENQHYFSEKDVIERLTAILMKDAPAQVEEFRFVSVSNGVVQRQAKILRAPQERAYLASGQIDLFVDHGGAETMPAPAENPVLAAADRRRYPKPFWSIDPLFRQELFDPVNPVGVQLAIGATLSVDVTRGLSLQVSGDTTLFESFNLARPGGSALPPVRTDLLKYAQQGRTGIGDMEGDYRFRLAPDIYAVARGGYLESMFAGAGGEVLWRPQNQRWALGVDAYEVWQRNYDRLLGLMPYHVLTGHVSLYYASPWYHLNFAVRAGQYLAGDRGVTFEMTRRFATGIEVGAFFTRTNVSAQQFGEGSFDKGIIIRVPLNGILPIETQSEFDTVLRPVQRDGGQRLYGDSLLYEETRRASQAEMENMIESPDHDPSATE